MGDGRAPAPPWRTPAPAGGRKQLASRPPTAPARPAAMPINPPSGGELVVDTPDGPRRFGITRAHLEEDAGKSVHGGADSLAGSSHTLVDFNRAGAPLHCFAP